jgi:hypothetical protein
MGHRDRNRQFYPSPSGKILDPFPFGNTEPLEIAAEALAVPLGMDSLHDFGKLLRFHGLGKVTFVQDHTDILFHRHPTGIVDVHA